MPGDGAGHCKNSLKEWLFDQHGVAEQPCHRL
jgi:hypothetical protein